MPVTVSYPDPAIAKHAKRLAARYGVSEVEALRIALERLIEAEREIERLSSELKELRKRVDEARAEGYKRAFRHVSESVGEGVILKQFSPREQPPPNQDLVHAQAVVQAIQRRYAARADVRGVATDDEILGYPDMFPDSYGIE